MTDPDPLGPVRKQLVVEAPIERAFCVFTAQMSTWWPPSHHLGASALKACVIEPRVGGRWYEVSDDDSEADWGHVLAWEPPHRLVLAWQLTAQFTYDPALVTEIEVRFTALGPGRTQVDFEHRDMERFGATAAAHRSLDRGWPTILDHYVRSTLPT